MSGGQKHSGEAPYRQIPQLPDLSFSGKTGPDGMLTIRNIPAEAGGGLSIASAYYHVPLQDPKGWRNPLVRERFEPDVTNKLDMIMEPKGTDCIGKR